MYLIKISGMKRVALLLSFIVAGLIQLSAQNNIQVANLTTPSQIFHALRRQVKREFRKPLIIISPKSLLRHPRATSSLEELANGSFQEVIADPFISNPKKVEKIVLVSGKLYYELLEEREKTKDLTTALVRVEQISPFPSWKVKEILALYENANKLVWTQEEPKNMGSYQFVHFRIVELLASLKSKLEFIYVGRTERSSPATGSIYRHRVEQQKIITDVFKV